MKVLVTEEDVTTAEIVSLYLKGKGHQVVCATGGIEALEKFVKEGPFDVVVSALDMPYLNGIELLRTIRKDYQSDTPVIITSYIDDEAEKNVAIQEGADAFLIKPLTETMVNMTIKNILKVPNTGR